MSIISILRGSRQRDHEFKANLRYTANPSLKTTTKIHHILELSRVYKAKSPGPLTTLGGSAFIGHATVKWLFLSCRNVTSRRRTHSDSLGGRPEKDGF